MSPAIQAILVALISIGASSGFWSFIQARDKTKSATVQLLMNLGKEQIVKLGMSYLERGWITRDELEDLQKDLHGPYLALGGNGIADRIMADVKQLPLIQPAPRYVSRADGTDRNDRDYQQ